MRSKFIVPATLALLTAACASKTAQVDPSTQPAVAPVATPAAPTTPAIPAVTKDGTSVVTCDKGKDHRTLELRTKGKGCELAYTKAGQAAVVATGAHGLGRCEPSLKKIQAKLSGAGYDCK